MSKVKQVLTIAGSDSGGGAGIQADLKTFQERGVFGTSVLTAVTAQNTKGVHDVHEIPLENVKAQLSAIFDDFTISAIKTGMLVNDNYIKLILSFLEIYQDIPVIIDPVMIAKGGQPLMEESAIDMMRKMLSVATIITPNIPEAESLSGIRIKSKEDIKEAAKVIQEAGSKNVLVKGGHSIEGNQSNDYILLADGSAEWLLAERIDTKDTHGTGCTYSACITAEIAKNKSPLEAVRIGKAFIHSAIKNGIGVGHGHGPTNHWAYASQLKDRKRGNSDATK